MAWVGEVERSIHAVFEQLREPDIESVRIDLDRQETLAMIEYELWAVFWERERELEDWFNG